MKINKKNLDNILNIKDNHQLCNDLIFYSFFNKLKGLDIEKIDSDKSYINIVDKNYNPLDLSFNEWDKKFNDFGCSYSIKLVSKNNCCLNLKFLLWDSQVNIYLGNHLIHYADDAEVRTKKDLDNFNNYLSLLLKSRIEEELCFVKNNLKKAIYKFYSNKDVKIFKHKIGFPLLFKRVDKVTNQEFQPWTNQ